MKTWFMFCINGETVGTWANNEEEARENIAERFGGCISRIRWQYLL